MPQQPLHQVAGTLQLADDGERRDEPERADHERALACRTGRRRSPRCGSAGRSRPRSAPRRSPAPSPAARGSSRGKNPKMRGQQRRGVERVGAVVLAQHAALADAVLEDVGADLLGGRCPRRSRSRSPRDRRQLGGAVERHPAHQLRGDVVLRLAARLPDALVGLAPGAGRARAPAPRRSATAAAAAAGCGGCGAGSSRAPRRRRRSGAGRTRRCRSAPAARRRSPRGRRASTRSGPGGRRCRT